MQLKAKVENKVSENVINNLLGSFIEILKLTLYGNERKMGTIHVHFDCPTLCYSASREEILWNGFQPTTSLSKTQFWSFFIPNFFIIGQMFLVSSFVITLCFITWKITTCRPMEWFLVHNCFFLVLTDFVNFQYQTDKYCSLRLLRDLPTLSF